MFLVFRDGLRVITCMELCICCRSVILLCCNEAYVVLKVLCCRDEIIVR